MHAFIIDEIRKQEELEREKEQPRLELPLYEMPSHNDVEASPVQKEERGVCIIEL